MIKRRLTVLLTALALMLGVSLVAASPAQAAWSDCDYGTNCFYNGSAGSGAPFESDALGWPNHTCLTLPVAWRNVASSLYNRAPDTRIRYFGQTNCQGGAFVILTFGQRRSPLNGGHNNQIESYEVCYTLQSNCSLDDAPGEGNAHNLIRSSANERAVALASCTTRFIGLAAHPTFNSDTGNWRTNTYTSGSSCGAVSMADTQWYYQIPGRTPQLVLGCAEYRVRTFWAGTETTKVVTGWENVCQDREQVHETISTGRDFRVEIRHPMESQRRSSIQPFFNLLY